MGGDALCACTCLGPMPSFQENAEVRRVEFASVVPLPHINSPLSLHWKSLWCPVCEALRLQLPVLLLRLPAWTPPLQWLMPGSYFFKKNHCQVEM